MHCFLLPITFYLCVSLYSFAMAFTIYLRLIILNVLWVSMAFLLQHLIYRFDDLWIKLESVFIIGHNFWTNTLCVFITRKRNSMQFKSLFAKLSNWEKVENQYKLVLPFSKCTPLLNQHLSFVLQRLHTVHLKTLALPVYQSSHIQFL